MIGELAVDLSNVATPDILRPSIENLRKADETSEASAARWLGP